MAIITVNGVISAENLGITLPHEHIFIDLRNQFVPYESVIKKAISEQKVSLENLGILRRYPNAIKDNLVINDIHVAISEVMKFKMAGGGTIVDVTNLGLGRDPEALRAVSADTGVQIVMGCGYYYQATHPHDMDTKSVEQIAEEMLHDIYIGVEDTGVRAGVIGELGVSPDMHPDEEKVLKAGAIVQARTGLALHVHIFPWGKNGEYPLGLKALDILEKYGADLTKVVIDHTDTAIDFDIQYIREIIKRGSYAELDNFGTEYYVNREDRKFLASPIATDIQRAKAIKILADEGHLENILISNDICHKTQLHAYGGWGYDHIIGNVKSVLLDAGLTMEEIDILIRANPKKLLESNVV